MISAASPNVVEAPEWRARRYCSVFAVAGIRVGVVGQTPGSVDLGPQLHPFLAKLGDDDIELSVEWKPTLDPCGARPLFDSGCVWSVCDVRGQFVFDFTTSRFGDRPYKRLVTDRDFRRAVVYLNGQYLTPEYCALEYPLDELLFTHYLSLGRGVELHGCGVVDADGGSYLFVGHSGAGKSTTARLWTRHLPVQVLSDDRIIVRKQDGRFFMHGTPWHGEAAFALPGSAPLRRIFLLEHGAENRIQRISKNLAVGELLARSFTPFYASRLVEPVLTLLETMVESVPCYRFQFVPDPSAVEKILGFRD